MSNIKINIKVNDEEENITADAYLLVYKNEKDNYIMTGMAGDKDLLGLAQFMQLSIIKGFLKPSK